MGAGMPKAFAIVLLSQNARDRVATEEGRRECEASLTLLLKTVNSQVEAHERLAFLVATDEPWTIANGFLTPTMKLKRSVLEKYYAASIADWSSQGTAVIWHTRPAVTT
jgi:long-subunit acyl-CoA synthetase (AMP-forming)